MCKEVILVPSGIIKYIDSFPSGWILWHHWLKQRKGMVRPESAMEWCKVDVVTELQWLAGKVF